MEITVAWMVHRPTEATVIGKTKSWRARAAGAVVIAFAALGFAPAVAGAADPVYGVSTASPLKAKDLQELADGGVQALRLEISWNATKGKGGAVYQQYNGFCLEAQKFPDSVNKPEWKDKSNVVLKPGETYKQTTVYQFKW